MKTVTKFGAAGLLAASLAIAPAFAGDKTADQKAQHQAGSAHMDQHPRDTDQMGQSMGQHMGSMGQMDPEMRQQMSKRMAEKLGSLKGEEFDNAFLSHMIEHHRAGMQMAELAANRAQDRELKTHARETAKDHQKDIDQMQQMLGASGTSHHVSTASSTEPGDVTGLPTPAGVVGDEAASMGVPAPSPTGRTSKEMMKDRMQQQMTGKLESAEGAEFDRMFIDHMLRHHEMAKQMAEMATTRASREEVKQFAQQTASEQQRDIEELKRLKKE